MKLKTLQEQYNNLQKGKGSKDVFLKEAKRIYPNMITNAATFEQATEILKQRSVISENVYVATGKKNTPDWFNIFDENMNLISEEEAKAIEKKTIKSVVDKETAGYDYKDENNINNMNFEEFLRGYYTELRNPKNQEKTEQQLKDIVKKNLEKDPMYYVEKAQFGVEGIGYTEDAVSLKPKEIKGKYASSGHGEPTNKDFPEGRVGTGYLDLNENKENMISLKSLVENGPLGQKPLKRKPKIKKETIDTKLAEIEKQSKVVALEAKMEAIDEVIESKTKRLNLVSEDESLSELIDSKKVKLMQKEIKDLQKRKLKMEKLYEKMCGKKYRKQEVVDEDLGSTNYAGNTNNDKSITAFRNNANQELPK